jgi:NTP pyrophosphatase (non-canonical NTP hydrolase)
MTAQERLDAFLASPEDQELMAFWLNRFAELCAAGAEARGFHEDEQTIRSCVGRGLVELTPHIGQEQFIEKQCWFDSCVLQAELARQASEVGEAVEAVRKPGLDSHCPQHSSFLIEEADVLIRVGDTCGKRGLPLGEAVVDKLLFNMTRPHKHGKGS